MDLCTGCEACELACSFIKDREFNWAASRIRILKFEEAGVDAPVFCQQCEAPRCVEACPRHALVVKEETGILVVDEKACDGCGICAVACPFGAISLHPQSGKRHKTILKCDLCGGDPECVKWCEIKAIEMVDAGEQERIAKGRENLLMARQRYEIEHRAQLWKY
jgi:Fe-S-cluster-containing hydrogenase component 2